MHPAVAVHNRTGPILFRFNRVTALSEEEAHRHRSPWRAAPWFSDSLPTNKITNTSLIMLNKVKQQITYLKICILLLQTLSFY